MQLPTLARRASSKDSSALEYFLVEQPTQGYVARCTKLKEFYLEARKRLRDIGFAIDDFNELARETTITLGGKRFNIDYRNLLSLYMHMNAEGNLRRLLKTAGLNFSVYDKFPRTVPVPLIQGQPYRLRKIRTGRIHLSELKQAVAKLPDKFKKLGDMAFDFNYQVQAPAINETSIKLQNHELARYKKYWPVSRETERGVEGSVVDISTPIENQGRYLPRTGGSERINIKPFDQEFIRNMQMDATFYGMSIPMKRVRTLLGDRTFRKMMKSAGRSNELYEMITLVRRAQGLVTEQSILDMYGSQVLGRFGKSILSIRPSGMGVQIASLPAAYEAIEPKYFVGISPPTAGDINAMKEIMPDLWTRWEAKQFDFAVGLAVQRHAFESLLLEKAPISDKFLLPYTWGDQVAIHQIYEAANRKVSAETQLTKGTNNYNEAVIKLTRQALWTQPQWSAIHRCDLTSSPSAAWRGLTLFMSARNAQFNVLLRAADDLQKGRISKVEASKRVAGVFQANLFVSLAKRLARILVKGGALGVLYLVGFHKEKKKRYPLAFEKEVKKELGRIPSETAANVLSLVAVLGPVASTVVYEMDRRFRYKKAYARQLSEARTGNVFADLALDLQQLAQDFASVTKDAMTGETWQSGPDKGKPKWKRSAKQLGSVLGELVSYYMGYPYSGPKSDFYWPVKAAMRTIEQELSDEEVQTLTASDSQQKILENIQRMSVGQLEKIRKGLRYKTSGKRQDGTRWRRGQWKPDKEELRKAIGKEVAKRKGQK